MKEFSRSRGSNFGSFIVDARGTILGFDQSMERLTGWPAVEVVGRSKELGVAAEGATNPALKTVPLYEGHIAMEPGPGALELILHCRDGRRLEVESSSRPLDGPGERMLITVLRVQSSSARDETAATADRRDELTGLPNRFAFASRLSSELVEAMAHARPLSLILLDIDHLRAINDGHGYEVGNDVLRKLAGILRVEVEDEWRIARLGDDDFGVLVAEGGRGEARQIAAALRATVERTRFYPRADGNREPQVTLSLGAASFPADADNERELVERAREALDEARTMGRNRVWCYLRRPRVPVQVPVYFDGSDPMLLGYTRDLSPSGIFLQTTAGIDVGMRCALAFPLPGHPGKVHVVGRVVRTVPTQISDDDPVRIPGLGVEFERFGGLNDRRAIDAFLHGREATSARPENGILSV